MSKKISSLVWGKRIDSESSQGSVWEYEDMIRRSLKMPKGSKKYWTLIRSTQLPPPIFPILLAITSPIRLIQIWSHDGPITATLKKAKQYLKLSSCKGEFRSLQWYKTGRRRFYVKLANSLTLASLFSVWYSHIVAHLLKQKPCQTAQLELINWGRMPITSYRHPCCLVLSIFHYLPISSGSPASENPSK